MNSETKPFVYGFLFFIVFGFVELVANGVFILPLFLAAPVCFSLLAYVLYRRKERVQVFNLLAFIALLGITLISAFIPVVFDTVPNYLQNKTAVQGIAMGIGITWILAYIFFTLKTYQIRKDVWVYLITGLLTLGVWIGFDIYGNLIVQGIAVFIHILTMFVIKHKIKEVPGASQLHIFCNTILFYNGLEFLNAYGGYFI